MLGGTKMFTFTGSSLRDRGFSAIEENLEEFYHQLRVRGFVPILGTEDIDMGEEGEYSVDWTMDIIGKECDSPWDVRGVTTEGEIEWFTTPKDTYEEFLTALA